MSKRTRQDRPATATRVTDSSRVVDFDDSGEWLGAGLRYREFCLMIGSSTASRYAGIGLTVDAVIADEQRAYRECQEGNDADRERGTEPPSAVELAADCGHRVVWEADRVRAVLIPHPDGRPECIVVRIDPDGRARGAVGHDA